jgi:hypothetical protein
VGINTPHSCRCMHDLMFANTTRRVYLTPTRAIVSSRTTEQMNQLEDTDLENVALELGIYEYDLSQNTMPTQETPRAHLAVVRASEKWTSGYVDATRTLVSAHDGSTKLLCAVLNIPHTRHPCAVAYYNRDLGAYTPLELFVASSTDPFRLDPAAVAVASAAAEFADVVDTWPQPLVNVRRRRDGVEYSKPTETQAMLQTKHAPNAVVSPVTPNTPRRKYSSCCSPISVIEALAACLCGLFPVCIGCVAGIAAAFKWETFVIENNGTRITTASFIGLCSMACFAIAAGFAVDPVPVLAGPLTYTVAALCILLYRAPLPFYSITENTPACQNVDPNNASCIDCLMYFHLTLLVVASVTETIVLTETIHVLSSGIAVVFFLGHVLAWLTIVISTAYSKYNSE